jgi:hypothetical protein
MAEPSPPPQESATPETIHHHPGYALVHAWELEIVVPRRDIQESILLALNSFPLPRRTTRSFDVIWGPGHPLMSFPGPVGPFNFDLDLTYFYDEDLYRFLVEWHEASMIDFLGNLYSGHVLGYDDDRVLRYKADCLDMWCMEVGLGQMERSTRRQTIQAILFVRDIVHDFAPNPHEGRKDPYGPHGARAQQTPLSSADSHWTGCKSGWGLSGCQTVCDLWSDHRR